MNPAASYSPAGRAVKYLAKAKEADELAARATDIQVRQSWTRIAQSYRELASFLTDKGINPH